jgi:hypothetical protein
MRAAMLRQQNNFNPAGECGMHQPVGGFVGRAFADGRFDGDEHERSLRLALVSRVNLR